MITRRNMFKGLMTAIAAPSVLLTLIESAQAAPKVDLNVWYTFEKGPLMIKDMSIKHIRNCINFIQRNQIRQEYLPVFKAELNRRYGAFKALTTRYSL